ncbi:hypothetical protein L1887_20765 [Cichorium endivia]|nr:hypothetical protein L1887_20765 [Cichorium endivia]
MVLDNSYNSWADQWDTRSEYVNPQSKKTNTVKNKVGDGLGKTKAVALTGMKKVKQGTSIGIHWIKEKYNKSAQKRPSRDTEQSQGNTVNLKRYNSWADQWDTEPEYYNGYPGSKSSHGKSKVGEGFDKSKAVASTGLKKVKKGTTLGFHWIKEKYHKTTHK